MTHAIWLVLALSVGIKALIVPMKHSVWPVFALASQNWWAGHSLYADYPDVDMYRYSPTFAVAISPLGMLPLRIGGCLWGAGSVLLLYTSLRSIHRAVLEPEPGAPGRLAFLNLSALGIAHTVWNLQSNALLLSLMLFGTVALSQRHWWRASMLLAVPVYIKVWPLAGVALLAIWRPVSLVPRFLAALVVLGVLPVLASPGHARQSEREWVETMSHSEAVRWPGYRDAITICESLGVAVDPEVYKGAQVFGGSAALLTCLAVYRREKRNHAGLGFALAIWLAWQLLLGPGSERNTYGLITPFMAWELVRNFRRGNRWPVLAAYYVLVVLYSSGDMERLTMKAVPAAKAILPISVALFASWLLGNVWTPLLLGGNASRPSSQ